MTSSPTWYRWALVFALVLGFQVAFAAINDAWFATHLEESPTIVDNFAGAQNGISAEAQRTLWLAGQTGMRSAVAAMSPWRAVACVLLALACFAVVVQTFRLRFVSTSAAFALQLSRAATLAAILRTVDGAQNLVISRRMADLMSESMISQGIDQAQTIGSFTLAATSFGSVAWSAFVVGCFLALGAYFRSDGLKELLARAAREARDE